MELRRRPDRPAGPDRGRRAAVQRSLPAEHLRLRHGDEPLGVPRRRLRDADDRRLPALPSGHGRPRVSARLCRGQRGEAGASSGALMTQCKAFPRPHTRHARSLTMADDIFQAGGERFPREPGGAPDVLAPEMTGTGPAMTPKARWALAITSIAVFMVTLDNLVVT